VRVTASLRDTAMRNRTSCPYMSIISTGGGFLAPATLRCSYVGALAEIHQVLGFGGVLAPPKVISVPEFRWFSHRLPTAAAQVRSQV
jgi:hypothetical protein